MPSNSTSSIQAILFDLDNTLIDRNGAFGQYLEQWLPSFAPLVSSDQYPTEIAGIMHRDNWGYTERTQFCLWLKERYGINLPVADILTNLLENIPRLLTIHSPVQELLLQLKTDFTIGLISNGSGKTQRAKMKQTGLTAFFEEQYLYIEGEIGYAKPHPEIFRRAINHLVLQPEHVLFVGDDPINDMMGAACVGMKTCWVAQGRAFPEGVILPDFTIDHIIQLKSLFAYV